ncbi:hypothetical protein BFP70_15810 [Thioclava sp. SK-1]|uniref:hypothetical protein n=1 Tax=Thioclava sp. SK-1 TaxID=1889770 RepID=UPI00082602C9|nr:hypothetical protein [Thioclava sp. SK-1]OCX60938.1 hypothetical protein BFP70_15810 [Thioclava sp. SK-1]
MSRFALPLTALLALGLAGCSGSAVIQPEDETTEETSESTDETPTTVDSTDPNTDNAMFLFDESASLTLNSVEYDDTTDTLVINNLPYDGPDMTYDRRGEFNGVPIYASRQSSIGGIPTKGILDYYAVFISNDDMEAMSAASSDWQNAGFAGAKLQRNTFALPAGDSGTNIGEYIYIGTYAATRTFNGKTGLEFVTGDINLALDILDVDPDSGQQGTVMGTISNRARQTTDGVSKRALPNVQLETVTFETDTGRFEGGTATSYLPNASTVTVQDSGSYQGMIAGDDGTSMGALVNITGPAEMQEVYYEVIKWEGTQPVAGIDQSGQPIVVDTPISGTVSALEQIGADTVQTRVEAGESVGTLAATLTVPSNVTVTSQSTSLDSQVFQSDETARELGVAISEQVTE